MKRFFSFPFSRVTGNKNAEMLLLEAMVVVALVEIMAEIEANDKFVKILE